MHSDAFLRLVDTHCHLDFPQFDQDRDEVIARAKENGVAYIVNVGSSLKSSRDSVALANQYDFLFAAVGIHPHEADTFNEKEYAAIKELAAGQKVVAIGEIGLDYYKNYSDPKNQKPLFESLLSLARERNLPAIIHSREACGDTLKILKAAAPLKAVVHCFSGDEAFLKECLMLGCFISFTCNITFKTAGSLRAIVKATPLERILLETDAPYLAPQNLRGRRNEPIQVKALAQEISRIKEVEVEHLAYVTTQNATNFFNLHECKNSHN